MLSEELRRRLEALNRAPLPRSASTQPATEAAAPPIRHYHARASLERPYLLERFARQLLPTASAPPQHCDDLGEECSTASGKHALIRRPLAQFWPAGIGRIQSRLSLVNLEGGLPTQHRELVALGIHLPQSVVLLDLETCGFAGSMVFLVGLLWHTGDDLVIDQLLARSYAEEQSVLEALWQITCDKHVLVTFNGKSFDWPMVLDRMTRYQPRIATAILNEPTRATVPVHCDVLHHARRRWRSNLPNCKLQTLERYICGRRRQDDLPGSAIPQAYHNYVRRGDTRELRSILHHNALDLVTLLEVALALLEAADELHDRE